MKIETIVRTHINQPVKYALGIRVTYDNKGVAEVEDDIGILLIEKYAGQIFPAGKVVVPMVRTSPPAIAKGAGVEELKDKLQKANSLINDYKAQASSAKEGERVWRTKCDELMNELIALQNQLGLPKEKKEVLPVEETEALSDTMSIRNHLNTKKMPELVAIAEELKLPVEEYKALSRGKLISYLVQVSTKQ